MEPITEYLSLLRQDLYQNLAVFYQVLYLLVF